MKQVLKFFTVAGLLLIVNLSFAQEKSNPGMYMQYFSDHYKQVSQDMWDYMSAIARGKNAKKVESRRKELLKSLLDAKRRIAATKPFFGDAGLRDSTVSFLKLNYNILHEDYDKVLNLEEISEQSFDKMEAYILVRKATNEKMNAASDALEVEQDRFATEHHVNLIHDESKLGKKLARAGKAFNYYDELFLLYFKCQFQESNMINAMNKGDINAMEQSKNALLQFADEGLVTLTGLKSFESDGSLIIACRNLLNFYTREAKNKMPIIIDFYLKKENFEKINAIMKTKGKNASREEFDKYNKSMNEYNTLINKFNKANEDLNKERGQTLDNWNDSVKGFLDKHAG